MSSPDPVTFLPTPADLPLTVDHRDFAERLTAHLDAQPLRFGPTDTLCAQYLEALSYLARSYPEVRQAAVWAEHAKWMPNTHADPHRATPDELRAACIALYGLGRDRVQNRAGNAGLGVWLETAVWAITNHRADPFYAELGEATRAIKPLSSRSPAAVTA